MPADDAPSEWSVRHERRRREPTDRRGSPVYPVGSRVNERGHLEVGGCDVVELAAEFGTPAYVYAEDDIRARARAYLDAFRAAHRRLRGALREQGGADHGDLPAAAPRRGCRSTSPRAASSTWRSRAGFDPARIYMHGNNKTEAELRYAADVGVGHLILDSFDEIERLDALLDRAAGRPDPRHPRDPAVDPLLRPDRRPRLEVRLRARGRARRAGDRRGARLPNLRLVGPPRPHRLADLRARALREGDRGARRARGPDWECRILNVGGGLGIAYTSRRRAALDRGLRRRQGAAACERVFDPVPRILIEPGRSLVGNAGLTAYEIGHGQGDPGRADLRRGRRRACPTTCGRCSTARATRRSIANRAAERARHAGDGRRDALRVGRHPRSRTRCSPSPRPGDVLVTPATGAYGYCDGDATTTACRGRRSSSARTATPASSCGARPTTTCWRETSMSVDEPVRDRASSGAAPSAARSPSCSRRARRRGRGGDRAAAGDRGRPAPLRGRLRRDPRRPRRSSSS